MKTRKVEIFYGYYLGDTKMWDTDHIEIPDIPYDNFDKFCEEIFRDQCTKNQIDIAFCGIYSYDDPFEETE